MAAGHVSFFRNVYNGRPGIPDKVLLEASYLQAGARVAKSFLANGTLWFSCDGDGGTIHAEACRRIAEACGCQEPAYLRSMESLKALEEANPWQPYLSPEIHEYCFTLLPPHCPPFDLPLESKRKDARILERRGDDVLAVSLMVEGKSGYPTKLLETKIKRLVTTRNWRTILRLIEQFG